MISIINLTKSFFQRNKEWLLAIPFILVMYLVNVVIRSTDYRRFNEIHTIFNYLIFLMFFGALFITLVRNQRTLLANLSFFVSLLIIAELVFYFMLGMPYKPWLTFSSPDIARESKLFQMGYLPTADQVIKEVKTHEGDTVFNVSYSIDKYNRRTALPDSPYIDAYALFFGCSVTYGYGVEDNETIPYFFQKQSQQFKTYNYAYNGYGTQNMLAHLNREDFKSEIAEEKGVAIYVFLWSHILRSIGDMSSYSWGWRLPYYKNTETGVTFKGNFVNNRRFVSCFYEWALASHIIKYTKLPFPLKIRKPHLELTADLIKASQEKFSEKFNNDQFYVLIYPGNLGEIGEEQKKMFLDLLRERKIKVFGGYDKVLVLDDKHKLKGDPHPNSLAHEKVGRRLARDIPFVKIEN